MTKPQRFESIYDYLISEGFTVNEEFFVKDDVKFPVVEIVGHTPSTFRQKAHEHGWMSATVAVVTQEKKGMSIALNDGFALKVKSFKVEQTWGKTPQESTIAPLFSDEGIAPISHDEIRELMSALWTPGAFRELFDKIMNERGSPSLPPLKVS